MTDSGPTQPRHPFVEMTITRFLVMLREPEMIFWVFAFPLLMALALGIAFRSPTEAHVAVAVEPGVGAAEIIDGQIGLATFSDEQVMRGQAQDLIPRIEMRRHPGYEGQTSWTEAHNLVEVHLKDGRVLTERADRATTGALRGVTRDDVRTKFLDCAAVALNSQDAQSALEMLDGLEDVGPVGPLAELLGA